MISKRDQKIADRHARVATRRLHQVDPVESFMFLPGVNREIADAMVNAGLISLDDVRVASDDLLLSISGIGPATLIKIRESTQ